MTRTIALAWRRYRTWACTTEKLKHRYHRARSYALLLGVVGAGLGTLAGMLPAEGEVFGVSFPTLTKIFAMGSAVAVFVAGFIGREFLTPVSESAWVRTRLAGEATKREIHRALMRVPPYDGPDAAAKLTEYTASIRLDGVVLEEPDDEPMPQIDGIEHYIEHRVANQIHYYTSTAARHKLALARARWALVVVGLLGGLMGLVGVVAGKAAALVPMFASISAALAALIQSYRYADLVALYQDAALELELHHAQWLDAGDSSQEAIVAFVTACEAAMERENSSWRAGWLDGDKKKERFEAIEKARDMVEKHVQLPHVPPVESGPGVPQTS